MSREHVAAPPLITARAVSPASRFADILVALPNVGFWGVKRTRLGHRMMSESDLSPAFSDECDMTKRSALLSELHQRICRCFELLLKIGLVVSLTSEEKGDFFDNIIRWDKIAVFSGYRTRNLLSS